MSMSLISLQKIVLSFPDLRMKEFDIPKFRGYLSSTYTQFNLIHNQMKNLCL